MTTPTRLAGAVAAACLAFAAAAQAQTPPAASAQQPTCPCGVEEQAPTPPPQPAQLPATTTFTGDTGLWFVPTAQVLARGMVSVSGYRAGFNYPQGFTNVGEFRATFGVGVFKRTELFGALTVDRRIDRDLRPVFTSNPDVGGVVLNYPLVNQYWTGDNVGDLYLGLKTGLLQEEHGDPASLALRVVFKIPTADKDKGIGTGKVDTEINGIVSKEINNAVELSGFGGVLFRPESDQATLSNSFTWGVGAGFPSRSRLRLTTELNGDVPFNSTATLKSPLLGIDGSFAPTTSTINSFTAATVAINWQAKNGFFVGAGASWNFPTKDRANFFTQGEETGDFVDYQVRLGFHPGTHGRPVPVVPPPPKCKECAPENRPPTVKANCGPCTVYVNESLPVTSVGSDPDGDALTYRWNAVTGRFDNNATQNTTWTAPATEGPVDLTVTVDDGHQHTASDTVRVQVMKRELPPLQFEDVYFDFDRYSLRPEATRLLDDAVRQLQAQPDKKIIIEGHTCNIGTAEYNLALGDRRAKSVYDYLVSRGIAADRLETRSYGEERPAHPNDREETRRLNRRAALVVRVQ
jgi:outer membrane protein OmpA-like peptidoglycan-associated protein